jgi:hypothetical protein
VQDRVPFLDVEVEAGQPVVFLCHHNLSSVGKPQQHVAMTRVWSAPARQIAAAQLMDFDDEPAVV